MPLSIDTGMGYNFSMTSTPKRRFALHYVEMLAAMGLGMLIFHPLFGLVADNTGWAGTYARDDVSAMVMATSMVIGMSLWMWFRTCSRAAILEMAAAMYLPFVVLLVPLWMGAIGRGFLMLVGHLLMLVTMFLAMLYRRSEYEMHHSTRLPRRETTAEAS